MITLSYFRPPKQYNLTKLCPFGSLLMITPLLGAYFVISLQLSLFFHTLAVVVIGLVLLENAARTQRKKTLFDVAFPHKKTITNSYPKSNILNVNNRVVFSAPKK